MYNCIAIDDEFSSIEILTDYVDLHPQLNLLETFNNPLVALEKIKALKHSVDIIFMDIDMPDMSGLKLAELIRHKTKKLVFVTAHSGYAINSYEMDADGFLLKLISSEKFNKMISKLIAEPLHSINSTLNNYIILKCIEHSNQTKKISTNDIIAIEAQDKMIRIYTKERILYCNNTIAEIANMPEMTKSFSRIHRSFIIAQDKIKTLERSCVVMDNNLKINIGVTYANFYDKMIKKNN
jgi:DNA-binding LytR/AlgR family response regulator